MVFLYRHICTYMLLVQNGRFINSYLWAVEGLIVFVVAVVVLNLGLEKVYFTAAGHFLFFDCGSRLDTGNHSVASSVFCKEDSSSGIAEVTFNGQEEIDPGEGYLSVWWVLRQVLWAETNSESGILHMKRYKLLPHRYKMFNWTNILLSWMEGFLRFSEAFFSPSGWQVQPFQLFSVFLNHRQHWQLCRTGGLVLQWICKG